MTTERVHHTPRVIVQILGGLGNQMFAYATARRLALQHDAELVLDTTTRFVHDSYGRTYLLDRYQVAGSELPASQGFHKGWRKGRRSIMRRVARRFGGMSGTFLFDHDAGFQPQLLTKQIKDFVVLDGTWQDPRYFEDIEGVLREDFRLANEPPAEVATLGALMQSDTSSVSVHLRSYSEIPKRFAPLHLEHSYLARALDVIREKIEKPKLYVFTDNQQWAKQQLQEVGASDATMVECNNARGDDGAVLDMWLMSQCRSHVISNSTFGWWGAWLNPDPNKLVVAPVGGLPGNADALPSDWVCV